MLFPKLKRVENRDLLDEVKSSRCQNCGSPNDVDPAHIKSQGSGGPDSADNLVALCRLCHIESHKIGWFKFCSKYPKMLKVLELKGWKFEDRFGVTKLVRS